MSHPVPPQPQYGPPASAPPYGQPAPQPGYAPGYGPPPQPGYAPGHGAPQQYGQQPGYGAPQGYPAAGHPGAPVTTVPAPAMPTPGGAGARQCRFCGCVPAADVTFRGHRGMIVIMQFRSLKGPFCRDCGLATFRQMTAQTLIQGWYGYASFVITPFTVLLNLFRRSSVAGLPAPQPSPYGQSRQPMDPGPALLARPSAIIGLAIPILLPLLLIALLVASQ